MAGRLVTYLGVAGLMLVLTLSCSSSKRYLGSSGGAAGNAAGEQSGGNAQGGAGMQSNAGTHSGGSAQSEAGAESEAGAGGEAGALSDPCVGVVCDAPPANDCQSTTKFKAYDQVGSCVAGACTYAFQELACDCQNHACTTDPCASVTCASPPAPICKDANTATQYAPTGTCSVGSCSYAPTDMPCTFGCSSGACKADPCIGKTCASPPQSDCETPSKFKAYDKTGSCSAGVCSYASQEIDCTCSNHACTIDPCISVTCASPPDPKCKDTSTLTTYKNSGTCSGGSCTYASMDGPCNFGCSNGACKPDPCAGVPCTTQQPAICKDTQTKTTFAPTGTCNAGMCSYAPTDAPCAFGCANGACKPDPCAGVPCTTQQPAICKDTQTKTTFAPTGTCNAGTCSYAPTDVPCTFGCSNGACKPDPCTGVTCNVQQNPVCKDAQTKTTFAPTGTCSAGMCSYPPTDTLCPSNHACLGGIDSFSKLTGGCSTMCLSASGCGSGCTACGASTPICQINANGTTSSCVAATQGCNTIVQLGASVTPVFAPGQLGVGTQGTLLSGTYTLKTAAQYTAPGTPYGLYPEAETLTISVAGSNATFNSFQDYSTIGYQYRWTATVDTSAAPPVFKYTCITPPDGQPPLNTAQPFDYTVVNATTLVLFYPDNMGGGVKDTYTKQ